MEEIGKDMTMLKKAEQKEIPKWKVIFNLSFILSKISNNSVIWAVITEVAFLYF
jgi:hypothetical protein